MKIKKLKEKIIVEVDPGELLSARARTGKSFGDAIRFAVWEILKLHNQTEDLADYSVVHFVNGKYEVVIGRAEEANKIVEEAHNWTNSTGA